MPILTATDPERGIDWNRLHELVQATSDDDLEEVKSDYPWSAIVEIRSTLLETVASLEDRWEAIDVDLAGPRWLELDEEEARAISALKTLQFVQLAGGTVESS